jgi:DNA-binding NtrC family response regulator
MTQDIPNADKKTVMICEDDPDILRLYGLALKSQYNVILVDSGEECIKRFIEERKRDNKIHLLLLDYKIRDMPGDFIAHKIDEADGTKIILISAYNMDDSVLKELRETKSVVKFVKKPIHLSSLIKLVEETIG